MSVFPAGSEKKAGKASELLNKLLFRLDIVLCSVPFSYEFFLIFNIYEERVFFLCLLFMSFLNEALQRYSLKYVFANKYLSCDMFALVRSSEYFLCERVWNLNVK